MRLVARLMAALLVATLVLPALAVGPVFAAAATHLDVTVSPSSGTAGSQFDVVVTALDATEAVDPGYTGTVTFTSTDTGTSTVLPSDYTFQPSDNGTVTFANGATLTKSGSRTITATDTVDGSINGTSNAVTISAASADHIVLSGAVTNLASGVGRLFTATIFDQYDNIRTSDGSTVVSFDNTGGPGTVTGEGNDTASAGVATKFITGDLVGSVTITASAGALTPDSLTFTVVVGAASQIDLTGSTASLTAGATRVLTATIKDAAGNVRTGDSTVVTFAKSSGAGTVTGLGTATAAAGVATKTVIGAGAGSIDIDATDALITSNTLTFTVVVGAASQIVLGGSTGSLASGDTRILTATITDAGGNTITSDNSTSISFDKTAGAGTVTGEGTAIVSAGVATKTLTGVLAGSVTITATGASMTSNTLTFSVVPGAAAQIVLSGLTTDLTSGTTRVLTATIQDAAGNTETGDSTTVVTFAKTAGGGTVSGLGTGTASAGVASVTVTGVLAGSIDLQATGASQTSNTLTFNVVPGAASQIVLSGLTTDLTSGATRVLTATIEDAAGNVRTGDSTVVTFAKTGGTGTLSGLGADTASAGVASVTVTGVLAGSIDIHATGASLTSNTLTFTIVPGAATQIDLSGLTTNLTSGSTRVLTATLKDAAGNTETGDNGTVVSFAKTTGAGTVTGLGNDTAAAGVTSVTVTGEFVGSIDFDATAGALTSNTLTFTVVVGAASQIVLSGATTDLASGSTRVLTATIEDAAGNVRTGDSTVVTFAKTGGTGTLSGLGADTASGGVAQMTVTGNLAGSIDIHATGASMTSNTLTFSVVPGAASQIVLSGAVTNLTSGATRVLTATIEDAAGNVQTSDSATLVTFAKIAGAGTVTGLSNDTAAAGVAQLTVTGELVGGITIHATGASMTSNTLTFTVVVGPAAQIALTGLTTNLASGTSRAITATIQDAAGNTETGDITTVVTFAQTGGAGTVTGLGNDTASGGIASVTVTGVLVGSVTFTASASGPPDSNVLTFSIVPGAATQIVLSSLTTNLTSGSTRVLTATLEDAAGNVETGDNSTVVTFSKTIGAGTVTGLTTDIASAGVASVTVTGEIVGSISLHATAGALTSNTVTFTVVVGPATQIVLSGSAANLASGSTRVLTATIEDAAGNVETGDNITVVTFSKTAGTGTVTGLGTDTATGGIASITVTGDIIGSISIHATAAGPLTSNTVIFTVVVGPVDHIVLSPQTSTVDPGVNQAYTVEAFDAADNSRGDVTSATTLGIVGGTCNNTSHTCQALPMGPHTATATHLTKTDNAIQTINNVAPDAVDDSGISMNEDAVAFPIDVLNNDSDANGDAFTITSVTQGSGTVAIALDDLSVTYTPDPNANGPDTFDYTITDINGDSDTATVSLTVVALNDAPSFTLGANPTVLEDAGPQTVVGFATGSAGPPDEFQTLTYVRDGDTNPGLFAVGFEPAIAPNGDLTFTPAAETSGSATITVHLVDNGLNGGGDINFSATQTFDITVTIVDDPPVAVADGTPTPYRVKAGVAQPFNAAAGVLTNDTDVDTAHNLLTAVVDAGGQTHGTVVLNADGSFTYTPTNPTFIGADSFNYHANDGNSNSNIVSVTIDIYLNHAPTAIGDIVTVVSGSGYTPVDLLTNDNAANPDAPEVINIVAASHPIHGTVRITGGGTGLSYRPGTGFFGSDTFTYTISDGVFTSSASVLVKVPKDTVKPVATAPVQTFSAQTIGTSTVKVRLTWTGTDKGSGVAKFELWRSINGHPYTRVVTTSGHQAYVTLNVGTSYRFRVRAIDRKNNVGAFAYGPKFTVYRSQETSSSIVYSSPWSTLTSTVYSGGHARSTTTAGVDATFTTLSRTIAWVTDKGPTRGTADVYVDGVLRAHVTLTSSSARYRYLAYSATFATSALHSMRVVYTGGPTKRVDVDAFIFLR